MREADWERIGAVTGAISVLLLIVGFGILPTPPDVDAPVTEVHAYYADEQGGIQASMVLLTFATFFFIWFLGCLRSALGAAEGGAGRVSSIAFGGGLVSAGALFTLITLIAGAAFHPDEMTPEVTAAINDLAVVSGAPALAGLTALFAGDGVLGLFLPVLASGLAILATSGALVRQAGRPESGRAAQ